MNAAISESLLAIEPTLVAWLERVGAVLRRIGRNEPAPKHEPRLLAASEAAIASPRDIVVDFREGAPELVRAVGVKPNIIRYGFDDMAFGHALVGAMLAERASRPVCGEPASADFLTLAARIAQSDATVLVLGETGTGKEGVARFIHSSSPRREGPFVAVNCAALPETMLEAMLFGHQKGSFTGAAGASEGLFRAADGGTLMLDEIAEMPLGLQAKLLRAIQEREVLPVGATKTVSVNVRIVAAANRDLAAEVAAGRFRADLYWRLNVMPLTLKPLAERRLDIRAIGAAMLLRHTPAAAQFAWPTQNALDRLLAHRWPGNVRELENVLQRAILLRAGDRIEADDLSIEPVAARPALHLVEAEPAPAAAPQVEEDANPINMIGRLSEVARSVQEKAIREALAATGGHRVRAATLLGISERTLRYRLADMRAVA